MFRRKRWMAAGAPAGSRMRTQGERIDMTFMTSGSGPARRRARYVAGGVAAAGLLAAAAVGAGATGAQAAVTPGSLDTSFGTGGIVTVNLTALGAGGEQAALQEPNGDIVVALDQGMLRFLPNGQLDTSFGTNGLATGILVQPLNALAVQPNGQIITSGVNLAGPATSPAAGIHPAQRQRDGGHHLRHRWNHDYPGHPRRQSGGRRAEVRAGSAGRQDPGDRLGVSPDRPPNGRHRTASSPGSTPTGRWTPPSAPAA